MHKNVNMSQLSVAATPPFHFAHTAYSHGWIVLSPNVWLEASQIMKRVERLSSGKVVSLEISGNGSIVQPQIEITVQHLDALLPTEQAEIKMTVAHIFRADEDFSEFYALCRKRGEPWSKLNEGLGRLLRSPSVFEDVIKSICTTNIAWGGTKRMVSEIVNAFGDHFPGDETMRAFPTAASIAAVSGEEFADSVRLGYRAPYVHLLAQRVASNELDLEAFRDPDISTPELKKHLLGIKGVGNYAAAILLMLLGHYDDLAIDTVFRSFVSKKYFSGEYPSDIEAKAIYDDWGKWKFLAFWFDQWQGLDENL